jgi:YHYH protein
VCPSASTYKYNFPIAPAPQASTASACYLGLGDTGSVLINGAQVWNWWDANTYNSGGVWHQTATNFEFDAMDVCWGHAANGAYHHHSWSPCLAAKLGDPSPKTGTAGSGTDGHSPIYGWAADGYPIYGPWQASGQLAQSCWWDLVHICYICHLSSRICAFPY